MAAELGAYARWDAGMKATALIASLLLTSLLFHALAGHALGTASDTRSLFNGRDLAGWDRYLGIAEVPALPFDLFGTWPAPLGRGADPADIFSVVQEDGAPAIRISGEIWGALISRESFADYHLRLEFKWGSERFAPRDAAARNSGLLYHSTGPDGAFWSYWMRSAEFEIMEGRTGDFTSVDGVSATSHTLWDFDAGFPWLRYADTGGPTDVGGAAFRIAARSDFERVRGEWNQLDLVVFGNSVVHLVNGEIVFAAEALAHEPEGRRLPLSRGALQLQSEGAEIFFRRIELRSITSLQDGLQAHPEE